MKSYQLYLTALAATLFTGCANLAFLEPTPDSSRFYILDAPEVSTIAKAMNVSVAIGPSSIARYLDQPQIVTFSPPNRVFYSNTNRWAEPLEDNLNRFLVEAIGNDLGSNQATLLQLMGKAVPDFRVGYHVFRLGGQPGISTELTVSWWIETASGLRVPFDRQVFTASANDKADDFDSYVQSIRSVVAQWANAIAAEIRRLEEDASK